MTSSLVVAGQLHVGAFAPPPPPAEKEKSRKVQPAVISPTLLDIPGGDAAVLTGPTPRDEAYWAALEDAARTAIPAIVWEGDQHLTAFLLEPVPPFDFVLAAAPDLPMDPRASYVAEAHLRAFFAPSIAPLVALIARLAPVTEGLILVAGTPPPLADADQLRAQMMRDPHFIATAAATGIDLATASINSQYTIQKLWSLVQTMVAEATVAAGAVFVPVPDRVRGPDGFLISGYAGDGLHANAEYGREMLAELAEAAREYSPIFRKQSQ